MSVEPLEFDLDGCKVFVGRNNRQNDYIVSKLSRDDDLWFHTKDCAGSHVLLRCQEPTDKLIFECAKLAKEYSKGKDSSKVGVIYTRRKFLKKPPKQTLVTLPISVNRKLLLMLEDIKKVSDNVDMGRKHVIALVDCDSFFVSCEQAVNPDLKGKAVCVMSDAVSALFLVLKKQKSLG